MKKRLIIALTLLLVLSTYHSTKSNNSLFNLKIKEIEVENNFILSSKEVKEELYFLYNKNLLLVKKVDIQNELNANSFIESFIIKKIYPNKIKVIVFEKKPIAILHHKKKKFFYTDSSKLVNYIKIDEFKNLPEVFSDKKNFELFYKELKKINFPLNVVKKFLFFETKRWDLETFDGKVIKLPIKSYTKSLENFLTLKDQDDFKKYKIFDYRIDKQLILK